MHTHLLHACTSLLEWSFHHQVWLQDLIQVALVIAVLYLIYNTYSQIEGIK
jgi:hypothetical protein